MSICQHNKNYEGIKIFEKIVAKFDKSNDAVDDLLKDLEKEENNCKDSKPKKKRR